MAALDWAGVESRLGRDGFARTTAVLDARQCRELIALYDDDRCFRSRVIMARHQFGEGDYAYFGEPLPPVVGLLREALYARLAPVANRMARALGRSTTYPSRLESYRRLCRDAGQTKPTPLLLRYREGGYNRMHRDLYGALAFPLQATIVLSRAGIDHEGGEFVLLEDTARRQARVTVVPLARGEMVIFPVRERPVEGARGPIRATMRHGVSRLTRGERHALGIIFHDAA